MTFVSPRHADLVFAAFWYRFKRGVWRNVSGLLLWTGYSGGHEAGFQFGRCLGILDSFNYFGI